MGARQAQTAGRPLRQGARVAVIGAGIEGLTTAWHLQRRGAAVTVIERGEVGQGASHGNAGWLTPSRTTPLPDPSVLGFGLLAAVRRDSPLHITLRPDVRLWRFLLAFLAHCTRRRWRAAMRTYVALNELSLAEFDALRDADVRIEVHDAEPFLACFRTRTEAQDLLDEFAEVQKAGQRVDYDEPAPTRDVLGPALSENVGHVVRVYGQRYLHPALFVAALAASVRADGGTIRERTEATAVRGVAAGGSPEAAVDTGAAESGRVAVRLGGREEVFDAAVIATGAWLNDLAGAHGVRTLVQAGRGYSFSVAPEHMPDGPVYLPSARVACTPLEPGRFQIAGMMEFTGADAPLDPARIRAIAEAARPYFTGVDWEARTHEWVGPRPCTPDGLPLIGAAQTPGVFVNGGYGMWGVTLGPLGGRLLAERIVDGVGSPLLDPLDPLR